MSPVRHLLTAAALTLVLCPDARADGRWTTPPTTRLMVALNAERSTATTEAGNNYDLIGGGFGIDVAYYVPLGMFQPFLAAGLDANLVSRETPCMDSPFDPGTILCDNPGGSVRPLGGIQGGLRFVKTSDDEPGSIGVSLAAQYLVQGIHVGEYGNEENSILPLARLDYAGGNYVLSAAAGFGRYGMLEYATGFGGGLFDTIAVRVEYMDWQRTESIVRGVHVHVAFGTLTNL